MYFLRSAAIFLILIATVQPGQAAPKWSSSPNWSRKTFSGSTDAVFAAAVKSIAAQHHKVNSKDETNKVVSFHVGMTLTVWAYEMVLNVVPGENNTSQVSVDISWPHGRDIFGGSGKKEVRKIFKGIEKELARTPAQDTK